MAVDIEARETGRRAPEPRDADPRTAPIAPILDVPDSAPSGRRAKKQPLRLTAEAPREQAPRRRRLVSPLIRPILAINLVALVLLGGGLLYLDDYRKGLIASEIENLKTQAIIVASALGEGAIDTAAIDPPQLQQDTSRQLLRRLVSAMETRARLFGVDGELIADTRILMGPGGVVQIRELPAPPTGPPVRRWLFGIYDWVVSLLPARGDPPPYVEHALQRAADFDEARRALRGETSGLVRVAEDKSLVLSVAVPVQRYKQVLGALMLSRGGAEIERSMRAVRFDILRIFLVALAVTVLLSFYLASAIARPVRRLAAAADRVRRGHGRTPEPIPDFTDRRDEIGDLSAALREMTDALWRRMDAIERFAADVAHEIKNPLTSLRSAVETVGRVTNPDHQRKLMQIIQDDVQRLDRLISDISDASRLDAELSRAEAGPVDVALMLAALKDAHEATQVGDDAPRLKLEVAKGQNLVVPGVESRLVQVFRNLLSNAASFSPSRGEIAMKVSREGRFVVATVEDQGPGIPEGKQQAIFDRFYSERPAGEKFGTHSGLGLSISKQIIDAHLGVIRAENRIGADGQVEGARFIVKLPVD
ncbi:MAG: stimulus-sensing domain-containing protein [Alphaproteobacteria bacterium]|nr:stimulus-sensing domain-containing protein [Alphaproteobacteria bacterium]